MVPTLLLVPVRVVRAVNGMFNFVIVWSVNVKPVT